MNYSSLEEVYGTPFGKRTQVTHARKDVTVAKAPFTSLESRAEEAVAKNSSLVNEIASTLPLDTTPATENFRVEQTRRESFREKFTAPPVLQEDSQSEKLSRILRLIEQNRTGYERPATQDMVLYIATGIFFLFTFDTFVMMGKSMRGK
jgi:hypothetical protein